MALGPLGAVRAQPLAGRHHHRRHLEARLPARPRRDRHLAQPRLQAARPVDTYHGYSVQDFLEVDPRFGTRDDLVELVGEAHSRGLRIILDIIFNHSGSNWLYPQGTPGGEHKAHYTGGHYPFGAWRGADGAARPGGIGGPEDGVWPAELQDLNSYTRAGSGSLGAGDPLDANAEHKRSDFEDLRDFALDHPGALPHLAKCYKYWIALTDCDGFRIDTLKHV